MGYQGSEMDNEVKGSGNSYTTEFRQLDPRLGRWLSLDPVVQPWQSPYCSMDNSPIHFNDVLGNVTQIEGRNKRETRKLNRIIKRGNKKSETFREIYQKLSSSDNLYIIRYGSQEVSTPDGGKEEVGTNMTVSGEFDENNPDGAKSIIYFDPRKINKNGFKTNSSNDGKRVNKKDRSLIVLSHEIAHGYLGEIGVGYKPEALIPKRISNPNQTALNPDFFVPNPEYSEEKQNAIKLRNANNTSIYSEVSASIYENAIRLEMGLRLRETYEVGIKTNIALSEPDLTYKAFVNGLAGIVELMILNMKRP